MFTSRSAGVAVILGLLTSGFPASTSAAGLLYVGSRSSGQILKFDGSSGSYLGTFAAVSWPMGMTQAPDGGLYVADYGDAVTAVYPGIYAITPTLGTLAAANYDFPAGDFADGTLTVTQATPAIVLSSPPASITYDGRPDVTSWAIASIAGPSGADAPTGTPTVLFYSGSSATGTPLSSPPVNAGLYTAVATYAGDSNYLPGQSAAVSFTIARAAVTVTLPTPPASIVYDGTSGVTAWVKVAITGPAGAPAPTGSVTYAYYSGYTTNSAPLSAPPVNAGTYTVVASYAGNSNYQPGQSAAVAFTITQPVAPLSVFFKVDDGTAQRSMVRSLTVTFSSAVTLQAGAITLTDSNGNAVSFTLTTTDNTTFKVTFVGSPFIGGSLANGRYVLSVRAAKATGTGGAVLASDQSLSFWRLFGDFYGTASVNNADKTLFTQVYKGQTPAYAAYFDYDGNGVLNAADVGFFNQNFGKTI